MPTVGTTSKPAYVYDAGSDTWIPIGPGEHSHSYIPNTLVDAKGDLIVGTGADTVSRLAAGSDNQILVADSSTATGLAWSTASSGGMTLLETLTLSGASVTSSSIASTYKHLYIVGRGIYNASSGDTTLNFRFNSDTGNNYHQFGMTVNNSTQDNYNNSNSNYLINTKSMSTSSSYNQVLSFEMEIPRYHNSEFKSAQLNSQGYSTQYTYYGFGWNRGVWSNTAAITTITFYVGAGTFSAGNIYIYGVN